jgi:small-conductance mechanosensitive channel
MEIDDAIKLMREVGQKMRTDPLQRRNIWSPLEIQGVESFESGSAILRARFKTAPIKQWEVSGRSTCRSNAIWTKPGSIWRRHA